MYKVIKDNNGCHFLKCIVFFLISNIYIYKIFKKEKEMREKMIFKLKLRH